jgi:hypothetical protein
MNAQIAKSKAHLAINTQLHGLFHLIETRAEAGKFSVNTKLLTQPQVNHLRNLGFDVSDNWKCISWE